MLVRSKIIWPNKKIEKIIPSKADEEWGHIHLTPKPQRGVSKIKAAEKLALADRAVSDLAQCCHAAYLSQTPVLDQLHPSEPE